MSSRISPPFRHHRPNGRYHDQRGFTLVEVMVTAAVTIVAFIGLATLQVLALRSADSALQRARANELAYEMIDRMRLNRGAPGQASTALGGGYDDKTLCDGSDSWNDQQGRTCTHSDLSGLDDSDNVEIDVRQWWQAFDDAALPHWYAGIQRTDDRLFRVSVQWDDARAAGEAEAGATHSSCLGDDIPASMEEICVMTQL